MTLQTKILLQGENAARAESSIERVAEALVEDRGRWEQSFNLGGGTAGLALVLATLAQAFDRPRWLEAARAYWESALEAIQEAPTHVGLFPGFTGVAWVTAHHEAQLVGEADGFFGDIDAALLQYLESSPQPAHDLISGWVGLGVYALERGGEGVGILAKVLSRLRQSRQIVGEGSAWLTPITSLPPHQREAAPLGYYDLGMAHGTPGVISLLARLEANRLLGPADREMLDDAVQWLLAQNQLDAEGLSYPAWVPVQGKRPSSRVAWCYGDLSVAASLVLAGISRDRADWVRHGVELATRLKDVPEESLRVRDTGLCHGAVGVGHVYHRMANLTGDDNLRALARDWMVRGLDMRRPGEGIDGYATCATDRRADDPDRPEYRWEVDPGFLTGAGGVALALASALTPEEPVWDRPLLLGLS